MENYVVLKIYSTTDKIYCTMEKTMVLWKKNYGTLPKTMELQFTNEKKTW